MWALWASCLTRRSSLKRRLNHLYRAGLLSLCLPLANYLVVVVFSHTWPALGPSQHEWATFFQDGFQPRGLWEAWHHLLWGGTLSFLTPKEAFCTYVVGQISLTSRMRNMCSLYILSGQDSAPLCPCHYCYLKVSTGDKVQLFYLVPVVVSIWKCTREAGYKCLTWSPSISSLNMRINTIRNS